MSTKRPSRLERSSKPSHKPAKPKGTKKRKLTARRIMWTLFFTVAIAIICAIAGYLYITVNGERILSENEDKLFIYETSKVYDRNGNMMGELSVDRSEPVDSDKIPDLVKKAFIATEDRRFYEHKGVDLWSIGRAAVKDVMARSLVEGGSTITQQLAKNMFLSRDKTFFRKATEMSIAMALENHKTKDEIITLYLNRIFFGQKAYGIKAASERYFGVSNLEDLKLWQIASLAAIPKGPSKYNPVANPELSKQRRAVVLDLMFEQGYISAEERDEAKAVDYDYTPPVKNESYLAFKDYVIKEAEEKYGLTEDDLNRGGYKIYTTMDAQAQKAVEKAFDNDDFFEKSKDDKQVQASIVIMNHQNGSLVALLGGRDYQRKGFSRIESRRQPGSAFKPIVSYGPALESGKFNVNSQISNEKQCFGDYCPRNLHGYSKTIDMTTALTKSENIPAVWLLNQVGVKTGVKYAEEMGIKMDKNDNNLAIALGGLTYGTNTLEMAGAFSVYANGGEYNEPYSIKLIKDHDGKDLFKYNPPKPKRVFSETTAYYMTQMLQNVVNDGTGRRAKIDRPLAGKTGTTQHGIPGLKSSKNRDVWFVGYTPEWTAAIWEGYDNPDKNHLLNGSSGQAASLFSTIMKDALKGVAVKDFPVPSSLKGTPEPPPEEVQVTAPGDLSGSYDEGTGTVTLNWTGVDQPGVNYRIYKREATAAEFTRYMDVVTTSAEDLTVTPGTDYEYYVTVYDPSSDAESQPSNIAQVSVPADNGGEGEIIPPPDGGNTSNPGEGGNGEVTPPSSGGSGESGNGGSQVPPPDEGTGQGNGSGTESGSGGNDGSEPSGTTPTDPGDTNPPGSGTDQSGNGAGGQNSGTGGM
ncbi:PBP1A family penicillin-binding protein [Paenibacillus motobuensis]|uniref:Transglycosylase domain-containing protein n=1 Tax=Paenibacillus motobuensis TaxID=295324 RepID=A0ABN0Y0C4_9BACL